MEYVYESEEAHAARLKGLADSADGLSRTWNWGVGRPWIDRAARFLVYRADASGDSVVQLALELHRAWEHGYAIGIEDLNRAKVKP